MVRGRWLCVGCCAALACAPLQEGGAGGGDDSSSSASETRATAAATSATTTGSSGEGEGDSGSDDGPPPTSGGPGSGTDETSGGESTAGLDMTGSSDDTGSPAAPHDGEYTGTVSSTITVSGVGVFPCEGNVTFTVSEAAVPQVTGTGSCPVTIPELGEVAEVTATADGSIAAAAASGNLAYVIPVAGVVENTTWSGTFVDETFDAAFAGSTFILGIPTTYAGTWTATR